MTSCKFEGFIAHVCLVFLQPMAEKWAEAKFKKKKKRKKKEANKFSNL